MVSRCANPDMAMLNWIAFIKSLNPEVYHITGKNNAMDNILSRACYEGNDDMVSEDGEVSVDLFESARLSAKKRGTLARHRFNENYYKGECLLIRRSLSTMAPDTSWAMEEASQVRKKAYKFFLQDKKIWYHIGAKDIV